MIGILMSIIAIITSFPVAVAGAFYFLDNMVVFVELLAGILISTIVIFIFRAIFRKERPNIEGLNKKFLHRRMTHSRIRFFRDTFLELEKRSFASGHVARIGVYLSVFYMNNFALDWILGTVGVMVIVGLSRLYLKRHTFFDIITGAVIGVASGYAAFTLATGYFYF